MESVNKITAARKKLGLTQLELAKKLDISLSAIKKYEAGIRRPKDEIKIKMAEIFKTSVQELFY